MDRYYWYDDSIGRKSETGKWRKRRFVEGKYWFDFGERGKCDGIYGCVWRYAD